MRYAFGPAEYLATHLVDDFLSSASLPKAERSKADIRKWLELFREEFGADPVAMFEKPKAEPEIETGVTVNPVQPEPGTGSTVNGVRGSRWTPNHPKIIHKPPTRRREVAEEVEDLEAEKILAAYPEDRIRDRRTSLRLIAAALKAGVEPDDLKYSIKAYAKESEGYTRSKVCFSDN